MKKRPEPSGLEAVQPTCRGCAHWEGNDDRSSGFCLRYPPRVMNVDEDIATVWPITDPEERCGEYRAGQ